VAYIHSETVAETKWTKIAIVASVMIVNAVTPWRCGYGVDQAVGVTCHPRTLVIAEENSRVYCADLYRLHWSPSSATVKKYYRSSYRWYRSSSSSSTTQTVQWLHAIRQGERQRDTPVSKNRVALSRPMSSRTISLPRRSPRPEKSKRSVRTQRYTLDVIDVHIVGENGDYANHDEYGGVVRHVGRVVKKIDSRTRPSMAFPCRRCAWSDMKTNIHHGAGYHEQTGAKEHTGSTDGPFRGRIRNEQSAANRYQQLSRTAFLSRQGPRVGGPTLEIIADVQVATELPCRIGLEEELFYLRSRGLRVRWHVTLLMYAFAGDE
jgi:hypothetical protein